MKKFIKIIFISFALLLCVNIAIVVAIDPLFQYHKPLKGVFYYCNREPYQNPGIVKYYDYDSILLGSSMVENFKPSVIDAEMGLNTIKVPQQAATMKNLSVLLDHALKNNKNISTVFYGLDTFRIGADTSTLFDPTPEYLLDNSILNDAAYLFNQDILFSRIGLTLRYTANGADLQTRDEMWAWGKDFRYSESIVMNSLAQSVIENKQSQKKQMKNAKINMEDYLLKYIKQNQEKQFYVFLPPYSIFHWQKLLESGEFEGEMRLAEYAVEKLLSYDNVKIFYFQNNDYITNLYLYKDINHYAPAINDYMAKCFATGENRLTVENYKAEFEKLEDMVYNFDYDIFFGDKIAYKAQDNINGFLKTYDAEDDIMIITGNTNNFPYDNSLVNDDLKKYIGEGCFASIIDSSRQTANDTRKADKAECRVQTAEGRNISVISSNAAVQSSIVIDGVEYSSNMNGINIVVYRKSLGRVVDSVYVNTKDGKVNRLLN